MDIKAQTAARVAQIEEVISKYLPKEEGLQKTVISAMNYSIQAGGKRLRPMLMWETYRMFGGRSEVIEPFMAAVEMVHTYSLVHDDLPAMDNDAYRRGKKTTHAQFGEAMGILAGDGLLNYAFETAVKAFEIEPGNANIGKALKALAHKSGVYGMLGGQCVDVECEGKPMEEETLCAMYGWKTGALLEASMKIGAILAGATKSEQRCVEQAAGELGLAFQIQDDILDVTGAEEVLGKPVGSDARNHKTTYVTLAGLDRARQEVERLSRHSVGLLESLVVRNEFLTSLMLELIQRDR
ncbi:polyprenyl synthetase family protein [Lachnospiraceae bacterium 29-84]